MQLIPSKDGIIRGALIHVRSGSKQILLKRPVEHLYPLEMHHDSRVEEHGEDPVSLGDQSVMDRIWPRRAAFKAAEQRIQSCIK